jgi:phosphoglycolate phosphatase
MKQLIQRLKTVLQSLSFKTGVIVLLSCIPFYILSFLQAVLPISASTKVILWTVLFGMAKTCQYAGITILGVEGYNRVKNFFKRSREA